MKDSAFLGVESSLLGRRWQGPDAALLRRAEALMQSGGLPPALAALLAARGLSPGESAAFLNPTLRDLLPDPHALRDMEKAAARFGTALASGERIALFADYDVDGGASAALILDVLAGLGQSATLYIPDRISEGYGPNPAAMDALAAEHDLILCLDCGTLAHEALAAAKGADVVVLDHHLGGETLPPAYAIVNPNRADESGALSHLCAAGVVFLFLVELARQRRAAGLTSPDLMRLLDLVALATIADVAPLIGVNRAFVRQGLKVMAARQRPGLAALADRAGIDRPLDSYHLGFVLGPRLNAGGRIGASNLGARLLATQDAREAARLAEELEALNQARRAVEAEVRLAALAAAEAQSAGGRLAWAAGEGWHPGVLGIVAARLKEATGRPALVIGFDGAVGKGSARSVPGVDLGAAIQQLAAEGLIEKGGGHKMAAGLSLSRPQLEPAMARLEALLVRQGLAATAREALEITALLQPEAVSAEMIEALEAAGPFGAAQPAPRFAFADMGVQAAPMGQTHLRLTCSAPGGARLEGVAFGALQSALGQALLGAGHRRFHLAGVLELNHWQGRARPRLRLEDAAPA